MKFLKIIPLVGLTLGLSSCVVLDFPLDGEISVGYPAPNNFPYPTGPKPTPKQQTTQTIDIWGAKDSKDSPSQGGVGNWPGAKGSISNYDISSAKGNNIPNFLNRASGYPEDYAYVRVFNRDVLVRVYPGFIPPGTPLKLNPATTAREPNPVPGYDFYNSTPFKFNRSANQTPIFGDYINSHSCIIAQDSKGSYKVISSPDFISVDLHELYSVNQANQELAANYNNFYVLQDLNGYFRYDNNKYLFLSVDPKISIRLDKDTVVYPAYTAGGYGAYIYQNGVNNEFTKESCYTIERKLKEASKNIKF